MKQALVVHPWCDLDTNPSMMGIINHLLADGWLIDLFHEQRDFFRKPDLLHENLRRFEIVNWQQEEDEASRQIAELHTAHPYNFCLASDPQGISLADRLTRNLNIPSIYFSGEILFKDELTDDSLRKLKKNEIKAARQARFVIIQDEERAALLKKENSLADQQILLLPNSPADCRAPLEKSSYLRRLLSIPAGKKIILHTGSFADWTDGEALCRDTEKWPDEFVLVIHSRHDPQPDSLLREMMNSCNRDKIYFSSVPLAAGEYDKVVRSADIGLVLYKPGATPFTGKNLLHIGLSSGKFAYFARHGIPVIATNLPAFNQIFQKHGNGVTVSSASGIHKVLQQKNNFPQLGSKNRFFFVSRLNFSKNVQKIINRLNETSMTRMGRNEE